MTAFDRYRRAWDARIAADAARARARCAEARTVAGRLAALLVDEFSADLVVLIGSIARGDGGLDSDIDLVARGIPADRFYRAAGRLDRQAGAFETDLIPWETATPAMHEVIAREGVVLYER